MDSLTQFALGAAVSTLCLGPKIGPRKAAIIGGILGTLPDLDVLLPAATSVDAFVFHRGWSHAFFVHALATPVIGELLVRSIDALKGERLKVWLAVFLCFSTHAIIDAMTVYGTRLFWPFYPEPIGVGSIFIIDPLYSLPILGMVIWALARKIWSSSLHRGLIITLFITSAYMALSVGLQAHVEKRAAALFEQSGKQVRDIFAIAAPFNIVMWKVIAQEDGKYHNLYLSLFDNDKNTRIYTHPTRSDLEHCLDDNPAFEKLKWFSRGYYRVDLIEDKILVSDLRMGLTPYYVFRFAIADFADGTATPIPPIRAPRQIESLGGDFQWLSERLFGTPSIRETEVIEAQNSIALQSTGSCP